MSSKAAVLLLGLLLAPVVHAADCDNAFLPHEAGWGREYSSPTGTSMVYYYNFEPSAHKFTEVRESMQGSQKQRQETTYQCSGGNLTRLEVPQFGGATITKASVSGVDIPAAPLWKQGYTWASVWRLSGKQGVVRGDGTFQRRYRIVGREKVSVPMGMAEAWKVEVVLRVTGKAAFLHINREIGRYTLWYAEGWGLVRAEHKAGVTALQKLNGPEE